MMKVKCIAMDLDHTTLYDSNTLSPGNRRALEDAIAEGVHVIIASGRSLEALPVCVTGIPGIEYAITSNGAAVYRLSDGKCLRRLYTDPAFVEELIDLMLRCGFGTEPIGCEMFMGGQPYCQKAFYEDPHKYGESQFGVDYIKGTRIPVEDTIGFLREHREELDGIDLLVPTAEWKQRLTEELTQIRTPYFLTASVPQRLEFGNIESGKASGLRYLLDLLGIRAEETATFGDADNDCDMLEMAGYGIAVANATPACLAAADHVTKDCLEDGVAWAIRHILA